MERRTKPPTTVAAESSVSSMFHCGARPVFALLSQRAQDIVRQAFTIWSVGRSRTLQRCSRRRAISTSRTQKSQKIAGWSRNAMELGRRRCVTIGGC